MVALVLANYWEDRAAELIASCHIMAVLLGALDAGGEWKVLDDFAVAEIKDHESRFLSGFDKIASSGSLLCAMGAINHSSINHTTGEGKLQGFALKVARALDLDYPREQSAAAKEKREYTAAMLYAAAHPVSNRNMAYTLDPETLQPGSQESA